MNDADKLHSYIQQSQYGKPALDSEYWYSFPNQKRLAYSLAYDLIVAGEDVDDAIDTAKKFIDAYYKKAIAPNAW